MKKHIQIKNSYRIWHPEIMKDLISFKCQPYTVKNYVPYIIEWWLHNLGYYLTLDFIKYPKIKALNERFKHVDLMVKCELSEGV